MLKSMTGYGKSQVKNEQHYLEVELRSVNGRFLKFNFKIPAHLGGYENRMRQLIMQSVARGTVTITAEHILLTAQAQGQINLVTLQYYHQQLVPLAQQLQLPMPRLENLLNLPGVIEHNTSQTVPWELVEQALQQALEDMVQMRAIEGRHLVEDLQTHLRVMSDILPEIEALAPHVVTNYKEKLKERLLELSIPENMAIAINEQDLLKEVLLFAERADITEELIRLKSHLQQFANILNTSRPAGKKLEFLAQEIFREINTIGSKSTDLHCLQLVVELKTRVEKIKEQVQNIE